MLDLAKWVRLNQFNHSQRLLIWGCFFQKNFWLGNLTMEMGGGKPWLMKVFLFQVLFATCSPGIFSSANLLLPRKSNQQTAAVNSPPASTLFLPLKGNVYPKGYFYVTVNIGKPPKSFELDIDTGSDLTWVQCDAPCKGCTLPPDRLYKPKNKVPCSDALCRAVHHPMKPSCENPDQCDFEISYADQGSVIGTLVKDQFPLTFIKGSPSSPQLTFGCGYDIHHQGPHAPPPTAGVLGLSRSSASFASQLRSAGLAQNIVGHCLSASGGGFLFIGAALVPPKGISWTPMLSSGPASTFYSAGPAEILLGGNPTGVKGLNMIFDSGSSYTYLTSTIYQSVVNLVKKDLSGKLLTSVQDKALPVCWKGAKPFRSVADVRNHFSTLSLSFSSTSTQMQLPPEAYLIVTETGNVCLGILNGSKAGFGNQNVIGDISMLGKLVIYDNENQRIGWAAANCNKRL